MNVTFAQPIVSNWTHQFTRIASGLVPNIELAVPPNLYRRKVYFFAKSSSANYFLEGLLYASLGDIVQFSFPFRFQQGGTRQQIFPSYTEAGTVTNLPECLNHADVDGSAMMPFTFIACCDKIGFTINNQTAGQNTPRAFLGVRSLVRF